MGERTYNPLTMEMLPRRESLFASALQAESPLQLVGVTNPYHAVMAKAVGFKALYLSGSGVATASYGLPDLGMTTLDNVLEDVRRVTSAVDLPLLVDVDTGWGGAFMIARTMKEMSKAGAAGVHIEDQVQAKRCGHRPGKQIVSTTEMCDRLKAAAGAKEDDDFVLMARTDAIANEGVDAAIERSVAYVEAGAGMIFAEAVTGLSDYRKFKDSVGVPILANLTEFGQTPAFTVDELRDAGVDIALYPLTAFRAANKAAEKALREIRKAGTQQGIIGELQTRDELYEYLEYHTYESKLDELFDAESSE
jgi:methylisocitrate lyase|tara:strand:+ start:2011 stop:2931 length:921 start_codon:yes stop_codon:yes gene_type:complete